MLKKAESNAYSWWAASHIRTKQSKWLDGNLREMEDTVHNMLKLVEADADSFAKRAELYFKRRPELISFVEDVYRAYRALAENYDRISGELQKANHIIATACPEQVPYAMLEEEEDENYPKAFTPVDPSRINKRTIEDLIKKRRENNVSQKNSPDRSPPPEADEAKAQEEINKLEKEILVLQSEKEFVRSSYENGIAKYWEIEKQIVDLQGEICCWQNGSGVSSAGMEDSEEQKVMVELSLKSCEDAVDRVLQQRKESVEHAEAELGRINMAKEQLNAFKSKYCESEMENEATIDESTEMIFAAKNMEKETESLNKAKLELQLIREKINDYFKMNPQSSAAEVAEKVNELVNIIVRLEITVSSQAVQINRLTSESTELEKNLQNLEEQKMVMIKDSSLLSERLNEVEGGLSNVHAIEKYLRHQELSFHQNLVEACQSLNGISEKMLPPKPVEDACIGHEFTEEEDSTSVAEPLGEVKEVTEICEIKEDLVEEIHVAQPLVNFLEDFCQNGAATNALGEKKSELHEVEKKNEDYIREMMALIGELVNVIAIRDEEIRLLKEQLASLKMRLNMKNQNPSDSEMPQDLNVENIAEGINEESINEQKGALHTDIDDLIGKNLEFWLRFSTTYNYIQLLKSKYADLQADISKLKDKQPQEGEGTANPETEAAVTKRLSELKTELQVWAEQSALLREELERRSKSLNHMQEKITSVVSTSSASGEALFTASEAERLKGEVMSMKQESNKASSELLLGMDQVRGVQSEIDKQLAKLYENFQLFISRRCANLSSNSGVPLRVFLYGATKPKKSSSLFARLRPIFRKQNHPSA
ncbi:hypothetical protein Cni_G02451 [Canna indica]|uniref:NAB domain-containing protein n=1 Tax=Canna indica TaxID=4628 RepID=A0AAQ3PZW7_9LILI|nr:hypothetical protein Cni_G02451 [Canna indica]